MLWITPLQAQEDDKGFLTRTLQDALSGAGRTVDIVGFRGALSSAAEFDRLSIADDEGVWLTLEGVVLNWNRSALLRGRLEVENLSARRMQIPRLPIAQPSDLPAAEATPFSLPDLPVSININSFAVEQIDLGAPLLGEAVQLQIAAAARLTDSEGALDFTATRTDRKQGVFVIKTTFQRDTSVLDLLLDLKEEQGGIAARLLNLPDTPAVDMQIAGAGPLTDFSSDITVASDGVERITGQVVLGARGVAPEQTRSVQANIGGDITTLLAPRYRDFFGPDVRLQLDATRAPGGEIAVSTFDIKAQAADLTGQLRINAEGWPSYIDLSGQVGRQDGTSVLLPLSGTPVTVGRVDLKVDYDAAQGEAFAADFNLTELRTDVVQAAQAQLGLVGTLQGNVGSVGQFLGDLSFDGKGLAFTDPALAAAVGTDVSGTAKLNYIEDQPIRVSDLDLSGADYGLTGQIILNGFDNGFLTRLNAQVQANDLARFSALSGQDLGGAAALSVKGTVTPLDGLFDLALEGQTQELTVGITQADALLAGQTQLQLKALRDTRGTFLRDVVLRNPALSFDGDVALKTQASVVTAQARLADVGIVVPQYSGAIEVTGQAKQDSQGWRIDAKTRGPYDVVLTAQGLATGPDAAMTVSAQVPEISDFVSGIKGVSGRVEATGAIRQSPEGWRAQMQASGPQAVQLSFDGLVTGETPRLRFDATAPRIERFVDGVTGPATAQGVLRQSSDGWLIETDATGPYRAQATVSGALTPAFDLAFDVRMPDVRPLAPGISGPLSATGRARQTEAGVVLDASASGPYSALVTVDGLVTGPQAAVQFDASLPNIGALVDNINGPLRVNGRAQRAGDSWQLDTTAQGPSGTQARIGGRIAPDGTLDLGVNGTLPLGLARPFIAPRDLQGTAQFDLTVQGPPALGSVSGRINARNGTFTAPNLRFALQNLSADITLARSRAAVDLTGDAVGGGTLRVGGAVTLTGSLPADLNISLSNIVYGDPNLYRTTLNGGVRIAGPLSGGAQIAGQIDVGETNVTVPSTGLTSIGDIPQITHVGERPGVAATRAKAGLAPTTSAATGGAGASGPVYGLNVAVNAPRRIFVRGRGLDAELGGRLTLTGTTAQVISAGRFELLRGRLDILGKRFLLEEGAVQFEGSLVPYIRFVSSTTSTVGEVRVVIDGPADAPEVSFESTPERPQDEVLSQLLFGRDISQLSAFQALQLANAVATLAGRGGSGIIANVRQGFGLDDLDLTTTDDGATAIRAGKYLSENVYTDVTAASDGTGEVSLNIDITPNLTGKATLGSDGESSLGLFFEKDY